MDSAPAADQADYSMVKQTLLSSYHISTDTYRKKAFDQPIDTNNPDTWFRIYQQSFTQWIDSTGKTRFDAVLYELALRRLPRWLESQMRNLQPATFNDLKVAVTRYIGNQRREGDRRKTEKKRAFQAYSTTHAQQIETIGTKVVLFRKREQLEDKGKKAS